MTGGFDDGTKMTRVRRSKAEAQTAYDRMSCWYDLMAGSEKRHVDVGLEKLAAKEGEWIVDVGSGTGHALRSLARSVGSSGGVYGVDLSTGMLQVARAKLRTGGSEHGPGLIQGDGARLPLRDRSVDAVFMSFALELFDTPELPRVLAACRRVLKDGGRLCVVSLSRRDERSLPVRLYEWAHRQMPRFVDCRPIPVEQVLEAAGFEVQDVARRSMWTLPVDVVLAHPT